MRGIVIKPTPCCNNDSSVGAVFEIVDECETVGVCMFCGRQIKEKYFFDADRMGVQKNRVKILPDFKNDELVEDEELENAI